MIKKIYCIKYNKNRKLVTPKIYTYTFDRTLVLSVICEKCDIKDEKIIKEEEPTELIKILTLFKIWRSTM